MSEFNFEEDFLFAKPVKSGYLEEADNRKVYWQNGTGRTHSLCMKLIGDEKTRQEGWEKAVYMLACDEKGIIKYQGKVALQEFHAGIDRSLARNYGMMILGVAKGGEDSGEFEQEVNAIVKKPKKEA